MLDAVSSKASHGVTFPGSPLIFLMLQTLKRRVEMILGSIGNLKVTGDSFELLGNCPAAMEPRYLAGKGIFSKMLNSNSLHFLRQIPKGRLLNLSRTLQVAPYIMKLFRCIGRSHLGTDWGRTKYTTCKSYNKPFKIIRARHTFSKKKKQ